MTKVTVEIDLDDDFDGIDLECAIDEARKHKAEQSREILVKLHHLWVVKIGHPEWSKLAELGLTHAG